MKAIKLIFVLSIFIVIQLGVYGQDEHLAQDELILQEIFSSIFDEGDFPPNFEMLFMPNRLNEYNTKSSKLKSNGLELQFLDSIVGPGMRNTYHFQYDDTERLSTYRWITDSNWQVSAGEYKYNMNTGLLDSILIYEFNESGSANNNHFFNYKYNANSSVVELIHKSFDNKGDLIVSTFGSYDYNSLGLLESRTFSIIRSDDVENHNKYDYTYDTLLNIIRIDEFIILPESSEFSLFSVTDLLYNSNGKVIRSTLNGVLNKGVSGSNYEYDENENLISESGFLDDFENEPTSVNEYIYNTKVTKENLVYPLDWFISPSIVDIYNSQLIASYSSTDGVELADTRTQYFWSKNEINTGVLANQMKSMQVFPNPVTDRLNFMGLESTMKLDVFDILGRSISGTEIKGGVKSADVSSLISGNYFFTLSQDGVVRFSGKFMKQ